MLKIIFITVLILFLLLIELIFYAACVTAGQADREMEAYFAEQERLKKNTSLPDEKEG